MNWKNGKVYMQTVCMCACVCVLREEVTVF